MIELTEDVCLAIRMISGRLISNDRFLHDDSKAVLTKGTSANIADNTNQNQMLITK